MVKGTTTNYCNIYYNDLKKFDDKVKKGEKNESNITKKDLDNQRFAYEYLNNSWKGCTYSKSAYNKIPNKYIIPPVNEKCNKSYNKIKEYVNNGIEYLSEDNFKDYNNNYDKIINDPKCKPEANQLNEDKIK